MYHTERATIVGSVDQKHDRYYNFHLPLSFQSSHLIGFSRSAPALSHQRQRKGEGLMDLGWMIWGCLGKWGYPDSSIAGWLFVMEKCHRMRWMTGGSPILGHLHMILWYTLHELHMFASASVPSGQLPAGMRWNRFNRGTRQVIIHFDRIFHETKHFVGPFMESPIYRIFLTRDDFDIVWPTRRISEGRYLYSGIV